MLSGREPCVNGDQGRTPGERGWRGDWDGRAPDTKVTVEGSSTFPRRVPSRSWSAKEMVCAHIHKNYS